MPLGRRSLEDGSVKITESSSMTSSSSFSVNTEYGFFSACFAFVLLLFLSVLDVLDIVVVFLLFVVVRVYPSLLFSSSPPLSSLFLRSPPFKAA